MKIPEEEFVHRRRDAGAGEHGVKGGKLELLKGTGFGIGQGDWLDFYKAVCATRMKVIASDLLEERLKLAKEWGAKVVISDAPISTR